MGIIESAAEAAKQALISDPETDAYMREEDEPDDFLIDGNIRLTPVVRAILTAIREPSERMWHAGVEAVESNNSVAVWQAMIDAALAEAQ